MADEEKKGWIDGKVGRKMDGWMKERINQLGVVAHACNPSTLGG